MGRLIVIEGACDGIGKTTQFKLLKAKLEKKGYKVITHHFPSYGEPQGKLAEDYLNGKMGDMKDLSPYEINKFFAHDREITWKEILKPEYENGSDVLLDRYTTSTLIYQSANIESLSEKEEFIDKVEDYEYNELGIKKPDIVIFLTADLDLVTKMRKKREASGASVADIHEKDPEYMRRVYDNALYVADYKNWAIVKCDRKAIFGLFGRPVMKSKRSIHRKIYGLVKKMDN